MTCRAVPVLFVRRKALPKISWLLCAALAMCQHPHFVQFHCGVGSTGNIRYGLFEEEDEAVVIAETSPGGRYSAF